MAKREHYATRLKRAIAAQRHRVRVLVLQPGSEEAIKIRLEVIVEDDMHKQLFQGTHGTGDKHYTGFFSKTKANG